MRYLYIIFGFILITISSFSQNDKLLSKYLLELRFSCDKDMFPDTWLTKEINAIALPIDSNEIERSKRIIIKALLKYPPDLINKNLTKIYIVKSIEFYGLSYGGTNSTSCIYLSNSGIRNGFSDFWIEQSFHSELSSILYRNYSFLFDKEKWILQNDPDLKYGNSGVESLKSGNAILKFDTDLNKKGILYLYAASSIEEDFNSYAENLFLCNNGFWEISDKHKRIKKKIKIVADFYNRLDKIFDLEYFKKISIN